MDSTSQHVKTQPRKRSQADKKGRIKYAFEKISAIERDINEMKRILRRLSEGLDPFLIFDKDFIVSIACEDEVDRAILDILHTAGSAGILPKDILPQVEHYGLRRGCEYWHITRRIKRINRRLERKIGKRAAEKRGLKWALTSFMNKAWGATKEEIEAEKRGK